jgi:hypothetical protein
MPLASSHVYARNATLQLTETTHDIDRKREVAKQFPFGDDLSLTHPLLQQRCLLLAETRISGCDGYN